MIRVQHDFRARVAEIDAYFGFIEMVDAGQTLLTDHATGLPAYVSTTRDDLLRTFKASAILLLYNLMESTVSNAVEAVFDELAGQGIKFNDCRKEVRSVVLGNLKQHNVADILPNLQQLSVDIISKTFRKEKIVSGNVDAKKIKKLADDYGIAHPLADGADLLTVKTNRNDLAHGSKSFAEVGRTFTIADIIRIKKKVIDYLAAMLSNVAAYIQQQHYRSAPSHP